MNKGRRRLASAALPIMRRELQSSSSAVARDAETRRTILVSTAFLLKDSILPALVVGRLVLGDVVADAFAMERAITGSGLDWTIVRPLRLTNERPAGGYRAREGHLPGFGFTISRADLADFLIRSAESHISSRKVVGVSN